MTAKAGSTPPQAGGQVPSVLLAHHLKQLKLPTVLREHEKVAREAARDGLDHTSYLLRLVELLRCRRRIVGECRRRAGQRERESQGES